MASQIPSVSMVYSFVCLGADQRKHQSSPSLAFVRPVTGEFPAQRASNAEGFPFDDVMAEMKKAMITISAYNDFNDWHVICNWII